MAEILRQECWRPKEKSSPIGFSIFFFLDEIGHYFGRWEIVCFCSEPWLSGRRGKYCHGNCSLTDKFAVTRGRVGQTSVCHRVEYLERRSTIFRVFRHFNPIFQLYF